MTGPVGALRGWPDTLELVVLAVRAGATPLDAVESVALRLGDGLGTVDPLIPAALGEAAHRARRGIGLAEALTALPDALGPAAAELSDSIAAADRYGLPLAPVLDRLADEARSERRRRAEIEARSLPVRLSFPLVVCTLPAFVLVAVVPALLGALTTLRESVP
jgi:tight adherence protein C